MKGKSVNPPRTQGRFGVFLRGNSSTRAWNDLQGKDHERNKPASPGTRIEKSRPRFRPVTDEFSLLRRDTQPVNSPGEICCSSNPDALASEVNRFQSLTRRACIHALQMTVSDSATVSSDAGRGKKTRAERWITGRARPATQRDRSAMEETTAKPTFNKRNLQIEQIVELRHHPITRFFTRVGLREIENASSLEVARRPQRLRGGSIECSPDGPRFMPNFFRHSSIYCR